VDFEPLRGPQPVSPAPYHPSFQQTQPQEKPVGGKAEAQSLQEKPSEKEEREMRREIIIGIFIGSCTVDILEKVNLKQRKKK